MQENKTPEVIEMTKTDEAYEFQATDSPTQRPHSQKTFYSFHSNTFQTFTGIKSQRSGIFMFLLFLPLFLLLGAIAVFFIGIALISGALNRLTSWIGRHLNMGHNLH